MKIETVKEQLINGVLIGYKVNDNSFFPAENCELIKKWISEGNIPEPEFTDKELAAAKLSKEIAEFKQAKTNALNSITVTTTNGNTFDGNETARGNMTSAILSSEVIGKTEDTWKLSDNSEALITIGELKEALALSIQEVGRIVMTTSKEEL